MYLLVDIYMVEVTDVCVVCANLAVLASTQTATGLEQKVIASFVPLASGPTKKVCLQRRSVKSALLADGRQTLVLSWTKVAHHVLMGGTRTQMDVTRSATLVQLDSNNQMKELRGAFPACRA